jgi:DNA-binding CsgD family transcriptional regulator
MANEEPHGGGQRTATTRICVCSDRAALSGVRREFTAAGWTTSTLSDPVAGNGSGTDPGSLCVVQLETAADIAGVVDLLLQGVSAAVLASEPTLATEVFDQCRRVASAEWFDHARRPITDELSDEQVALLLAIRSGNDIEQAARRHHLSERTAARRLNDARRSLGARSTAEAVSIVGRRIDQLRGVA